MAHHSVVKKDLGDAVIIVASNVRQLEENFLNLKKRVLSERVVQALDDGWAATPGTYKSWR